MRQIVIEKNDEVINHFDVSTAETVLVYTNDSLKGALIKTNGHWIITCGEYTTFSFPNDKNFTEVLESLLDRGNVLKLVDRNNKPMKTIICNNSHPVHIDDINESDFILVYKNSILRGGLTKSNNSWEFRGPTDFIYKNYEWENLIRTLIKDGYTLKIQ